MIISKYHREMAYKRYMNKHFIISKYHDKIDIAKSRNLTVSLIFSYIYFDISKYHDNIKISP